MRNAAGDLVQKGAIMARRGRCPCGCAITAQRGVDGYKTLCPGCGATVRLRSQGRKSRRPEEPKRKAACACGAVVVVESWPLSCPSCGRQVLMPAAFPEPPPRAASAGPPVLDLFEESRGVGATPRQPERGDPGRGNSLESPLVARVLTALTAPVRAASRWLRDR